MEKRIVFPAHEADMTNWYWFPTGFSESDIQDVHKLAERFAYRHAVTFGKDQVDESIRKSQIKWLDQKDRTCEWLYDKIFSLASIANDNMWRFKLISAVDSIQYTEYREGGGHYDYHLDIGAGSASHRKLSLVVQLSDPSEYEGGQFEILRGTTPDLLPNQKGAVLVFPSYILHRVRPITKGIRRSLVIWVGGEHYQ